MFEGLPREYDVIVIGTGILKIFDVIFYKKIFHLGMVESILAAACGRIGKTVLHIDT